MDISESQLGLIMSCLLLLELVLGRPSLTSAITLLSEQHVLGRLYWYLETALDRQRTYGR